MYETIDNLNQIPQAEKLQNIFELSPDILKFGGIQKFVLLKNGESYIVISQPSLSHSEMIQELPLNKETEILGGGLFEFHDGIITIDTSFMTSKLGPIKIPSLDLQKIVQAAVGYRYQVELSV